MASRNVQDLTPFLQRVYLQAKEEFESENKEYEVFLTCTHRDNAEQERLYMNSRNNKDDDNDGKIDELDEWRTSAKPGASKHNKYPSEAFDIAFRRIGDNKADWKNIGNFINFNRIVNRITSRIRWGGTFQRKDYVHFEEQ